MAINFKKLACSPCESGFGIKVFAFAQILGAALLIPFLLTQVIFATQALEKITDTRLALDQVVFIGYLWILLVFGVVEAAVGMILFVGSITERTGFMRTWIVVTGISTVIIILVTIYKTTQTDVITPAVSLPFCAMKFIMIYTIDRRVCDLRMAHHQYSKPPVSLED